MARKASSKPDSGTSQSSATIGFEMGSYSFGIRHSAFVISPARRLAIRGIQADIGKEHADTFRNVQHPDLRADYVLATAERDSAFSNAKPHRRACRRQDNPMPFSDSDWFGKDDNVRWQYGVSAQAISI